MALLQSIVGNFLNILAGGFDLIADAGYEAWLNFLFGISYWFTSPWL